jgi:hypothetical protein
MRRLRAIALTLIIVAAPANAQTPGGDAPARITLEQFKGLRFLEGSWKGSGYQPGPFYESYRFINDSTIAMFGWTDSTFSKKSDSTRYLFRNGQVRSGDGRAALMRIDSLGYHFQTISGQRYGWSFRPLSPDRWQAVLNQGRTIYTLDRVAPAWPRSTPAAQGLNPGPIDQLVARISAHEFGHVDRLVIVRNGYLVVDERFPRDYHAISQGKSSGIGCGIGACADSASVHHYNYLHPDYHPWWQDSEQHTLQSVTKSIAATVIGAAMHNGRISGLKAPLLSFFTNYDLSRVDARLKTATLEDLLTMRSGIEWHEIDRPLDETNTTLQLERSTDWIRFTLAQPMDAEPGTKWAYNSGGSQLMAEVIRQATGEHADEYARRHLFQPLGITRFHWKRTPTGHPDTEGGLYLEATDLARIGQLYLDDGVWQGQRILPAGWARLATTRHVQNINQNPSSPGYGYQWWRYDRRGVDVWAGNGFGGQFLVIIPQARIIGVISGWNVFGDRFPGTLAPTIDALISAAGIATS